MLHKHLFITVIPEGLDRRFGQYTRIVCAEPGCGEVRDVYINGDVILVNEGLPDKE